MSYYPHTAVLRGATGLDEGARTLLMNIVANTSRAPAKLAVVLLFRDRFGSYDDYYAALEDARDWRVSRQCEEAVDEAIARERNRMVGPVDLDGAGAVALLLTMPEHDFLLALEEVVTETGTGASAESRIGKVCRTRGIPYTFDQTQGFRWVGDTVTQAELIEPALAAINDPRFAGGVRSEFETARTELRHGTANGRKQAVHEAGCAVESAMKVVLDERRIAYKATDTARPLFDLLEAHGLVPRWMEPQIFAVLTPRNKTAGHGGGSEALDPGEDEAASVVAAAAGAIAYLHVKLP